MLNDKQKKEIELRILKEVRFMLKNKVTIKELSAELKIPKSTIQRDLNDKRIIEIFDQETYDKISKILAKNKEVGKSIGGTVSVSKNTPLRDKYGKYIGNERKSKR